MPIISFSVTISTNIAALRGGTLLKQSQDQSANSIKRLSTGLRINSAKDDPAGLIAATDLTSEITKLAADQKGDDRIYLKASFADAVLGIVSNVMLRAKSITVQNANGAALTDDQLDANQRVLDAIIDGMDRINVGTTFVGERVFGSDKTDEQSNPQPITGEIATTSLGVIQDQLTGETYSFNDLRSGGKLAENQNPEMAAKVVEAAIRQLANQQAGLGNLQQRLVSQGNVRDITQINLKDALSRIQDTDFAAETANLARSQILSQSTTATMAIANSQPRSALRLLS